MKINQLSIFGLPFEIKFAERTHLPLSESLKVFHDNCSACEDDKTIVEIVDTSFDGMSAREHIEKRNRSVSMVETEEGFLFSYFTGQFFTDKLFRNVKVWSPFEREMSIERDGFANFNGDPTLRLIVWGRASLEKICYLHGSLIVLNNKRILCMGASGVGKTTLSNLACEAGATCLTEEDPFLSRYEDSVMAHASPWPGMKGPVAPFSGTLDAVYFLRHAPQNRLSLLDFKEKFTRLLSNSRTFNWLPQTIPGSIDLLSHVASTIPAYDFGFVPDRTAVQAIGCTL